MICLSIALVTRGFITGWEGRRLKGCIFLPPFLLPLPAGRREGGEKTQPFNCFQSRLFRATALLFCRSIAEKVTMYMYFIHMLHNLGALYFKTTHCIIIFEICPFCKNPVIACLIWALGVIKIVGIESPARLESIIPKL